LLLISGLSAAQYLTADFWIGSCTVLATHFWIDSGTFFGCRSLYRQRHSFAADFLIGSDKVFGYRFLNRQQHYKT
jgi:hypothetical protein